MIPAFNRSLCGYDRGEVDAYLATMQRLLQEAWDHVRAGSTVDLPPEPEGLHETALLARGLRVRAQADASAALERARSEARALRWTALADAQEIVLRASEQAELVLQKVDDLVRELARGGTAAELEQRRQAVVGDLADLHAAIDLGVRQHQAG